MSEGATISSRYTPEQRLAIETRDVSVSLSAGAGCGKTFVLTERFLSHLDPADAGSLTPGELSRLVAITFTERAAREMRERIRAKCYERLTQGPAEHAAHWGALLRALDNARISTIHAFCGSLLRARAVESGVDPGFGVLEKAQSDTLLSTAVDDVLRRLVSHRDEATFELALRFGLDRLREMVVQLVHDCTPEDFAHWLPVTPDELVAVWAEEHARWLPTAVSELLESTAARRLVRYLREDPPTGKWMEARRLLLLGAFEKLQSHVGADAELASLIDNFREGTLLSYVRATNWSSPEAYAAYKEAAKQLRDQVDELRPMVRFEFKIARVAANLAVSCCRSPLPFGKSMPNARTNSACWTSTICCRARGSS